MNDLRTIDRLNGEMIARNIPDLLAKGCFVVVEKTGLHVTGCEVFSGEGAQQRANAKLQQLNAHGNSTHGELHEPSHDHVGEIRQRVAPSNDDHLAQRFGSAS